MVGSSSLLEFVPSLSSTPSATFQSDDPFHPFNPFDQSAWYRIVPGEGSGVGVRVGVGLEDNVAVGDGTEDPLVAGLLSGALLLVPGCKIHAKTTPPRKNDMSTTTTKTTMILRY